jgi:hypothetical protein
MVIILLLLYYSFLLNHIRISYAAAGKKLGVEVGSVLLCVCPSLLADNERYDKRCL